MRIVNLLLMFNINILNNRGYKMSDRYKKVTKWHMGIISNWNDSKEEFFIVDLETLPPMPDGVIDKQDKYMHYYKHKLTNEQVFNILNEQDKEIKKLKGNKNDLQNQ